MGVRDAGAGLALLAAALGCASGCGTWVTLDQTTVPLSRTLGSAAPRPDSLSASVSVTADGVLVVTPAMSCERTGTERTQEVIRERYAYPIEGHRTHFAVAMIGGVLVVGGAIAAFYGYTESAKQGSEPGDGETMMKIGLWSAALGVAPSLWSLVGVVRRGSKRTRTSSIVGARTVVDARPCQLAAIEVMTPWGQQRSARVGKDGVARVTMDWEAAQLDALDPDLGAQLAGGFTISVPGESASTSWSPDPAAVSSFAEALGRAKGVDVRGPADGSDPPQLAVQSFESSALGAGRSGELALTVHNQGGGPAFRLVGITKSDNPALHGKRFSFGRLAPGATQTRKITVTLARDEPAASATVLVTFTEAGNNQPSNYSRVFAIDRGLRPELAASCDIAEGAERVGAELRVAAGAPLRVRCTVDNRGGAPATDTTLSVSLDGVAKLSGRRSIAPGTRGVFDVLVQVPVNFELDGVHTLTLQLTETNFNSTLVPPALSFIISRQAICTGKITRADYQRKIAGLEAELARGAIKQDQFDHYKEQLLGCLP